MITKSQITNIVGKHICKLIHHEAERLVKTAEADTEAEDIERICRINGIRHLEANLAISISNLQEYDGKICWMCGNVLETDDGKDYNDEPVKMCVSCGAY